METKPLYPQLPANHPYFRGNGLVQALRLADRATGASRFGSDAWWSITHPVDRLTGKGRAAHQTMAVPWVAGRPWFHGSPRAYGAFDAAKADASGMFGPAHYLTDSPARASEYAMERGGLEGANVTRFGFNPRRVYDVAAPASKQDVKRLSRGVSRQSQREGSPMWNAELKLLTKDWRGQTKQKLYEALASRFGKPFANEAIRRGGYDAISFKEGPAGGVQRDAMAVLNQRRLVRGGGPRSAPPGGNK